MKIVKRILLAALITVLVGCAAHYGSDREVNQVSALTDEDVSGAFIQTDLGRTYYELEGSESGKLVVLVHGFSSNTTTWVPTKKALVESGFRVLVLDLFGRGFSDRLESDYGMQLYVDQIDQLLKGLNIEQPFYMVGNSMGGAVVTHFVNRFPEKVEKIVFFAPLIETPFQPALIPLKVPYLGEYLAKVAMVPKLQSNLSQLVFKPQNYPEWEVNFVRQSTYEGFALAMLESARYLDGKNFEVEYQQLGEKNIPIQLFWGVEDETLEFAYSEKVLSALGEEVYFFDMEKTGHMPHYEKPDWVNPRLITFLNL